MSDPFFFGSSEPLAAERTAEPGLTIDLLASAGAADLLESECEAHCAFPPPGA